MFISWYWLLAAVLLVAGYIHGLRRSYKACRHDREAIYKGYQRVQEELNKRQRVGQKE
ncbi:hypothetical protein Q5705_14245 [Kosakonia sp. H02]|nr:hypothetical protein Q5705_14245 [Kosakonia sp. H02]